MSSAFLRRVLCAGLLMGSVCCGAVALGNTGSLESALAGQLLASDPAPLLGPITAAGRKGWDCKPEHAAAAARWQAAELPPGPQTP